jgi:ADP-ribose pyrophosphatase YjhB (NUDIX family)
MIGDKLKAAFMEGYDNTTIIVKHLIKMKEAGIYIPPKGWVRCDGGAFDQAAMRNLMEILFPVPEHEDLVISYDRRDEE